MNPVLNNNPYVPYVERFENSFEFSYLADIFNKTGSYTNIPSGTMEYKEFWDDIEFKCKYGFKNSKGISITGKHFFYLNFVQILAKDEVTGRKAKLFPRFLDVDYAYFWMLEYCKTNGKHMILVKGRRLGFSYKCASVVAHEFTFYRDSKSVVAAFLSALGQNTMNFVLDNLNFLNNHTPFKKTRNPDTKEFVKARFQKNIGGTLVWAGYQSEVRLITFQSNAYAGVGLSANLLMFEEAGVFENIISSYNMSEPLLMDGNDVVGTAVLFGSAGSVESNSNGFSKMFFDPAKYNMLEFTHPEKPEVKIGWFVSAAWGRMGTFKGKPMVDADGNSDVILAEENLLHMRDVKRGNDPKALHDLITQYPLSPEEAFLRSKGNIFGSHELLEWLGQVETIPELKNAEQRGELVFSEDNKIEFRPDATLPYIVDFPLRNDDNATGCITIWERPETQNGTVPPFLYIAGCDPYDQDKSGVGSLGSMIIYKRFLKAGSTYNTIVAEYTGRPERADDFYENCRRLLMYYNAKCLYENQLTGLKVYFQNKNSLHLLFESPQIIKDIVKDSKVSRGYGIHMNRGSGGASGIKDQCEIYLKQWLQEEREDVDGKKILNMHTIKSPALLKELIAYDREINTDRVIALMLCILQTKELHKIHLQENVTTYATDPFFQRKLFKKTFNPYHTR